MRIRTDAERKAELMNCIVWSGIWLMMLYAMTGCTNWQGAEFRIGIGQYNGANETKTYTKEVEKK